MASIESLTSYFETSATFGVQEKSVMIQSLEGSKSSLETSPKGALPPKKDSTHRVKKMAKSVAAAIRLYNNAIFRRSRRTFNPTPRVSPKHATFAAVDPLVEERKRGERILEEIRSTLLPSEIQHITELYDDVSPMQTISDLQRAFATIGQHLTEADIDVIAKACNFVPGAVLSLEVFLLIMCRVKRRHLRSVVDDVTAAFLALTDNGETLKADAFRAVVKKFSLTVDIDTMLSEADSDGSGLIDAEEFAAMINSIKEDDAGFGLHAASRSAIPSAQNRNRDRQRLEIQSRRCPDSTADTKSLTPCVELAIDRTGTWSLPSLSSTMSAARGAAGKERTPQGENRLLVVDPPHTAAPGEGKTEYRAPPRAPATRLSALFDRNAPQWRVRYSDFMYRL